MPLDSAILNLTGDFSIKRGADYTDWILKFIDDTGAAIDLSGASGTLVFYPRYRDGAEVSADLNFTDAAVGEIRPTLTDVQTLSMISGVWTWELFFTLANGDLWCPLEGEAVVRE